MERTGFSKNIITKAIHTLEVELYVKCIGDQRNKRAEFGVNEYLVCHPSTGEPLTTTKSTSFYYGNDIGYFTVPKDVVFRTEERWSLANMTGSEISVYSCLLWLADKSRRNEVEFHRIRTRKLSGLGLSTFKKAVLGLETKGLIWFRSSDVLVLCDPHRGTGTSGHSRV